MEYVYHGSKTPEIKTLEARKSTHGKEYVYATPSKELAMVMSIHMTDLNARISGSGLKDDPVVIVERKPGVFNKYLHRDTNVYTLDGSDFYHATDWAGEVVSEKSQDVLKEEHIDDVYAELQKKEQEGTLKLYYYPDRPADMPLDNSDLISHWLDAGNVNLMTKISQLMGVAVQYPKLIGKIISESVERIRNKVKALPTGKKNTTDRAEKEESQEIVDDSRDGFENYHKKTIGMENKAIDNANSKGRNISDNSFETTEKSLLQSAVESTEQSVMASDITDQKSRISSIVRENKRDLPRGEEKNNHER